MASSGPNSPNLGRKIILLTRKERALLDTLVSRPGKVFRREDLLSAVWGPKATVLLRNVDVQMAKVRKKLAQISRLRWRIDTVCRIGYKLKRVGFERFPIH